MTRFITHLRTSLRMDIVAITAAGMLVASSAGIATAATFAPTPIVRGTVAPFVPGAPTSMGCALLISPRSLMPCRM